MPLTLDRRTALLSGFVAILGSPSLARQDAPARPQRPPALEPDLVREFVGAAHGNMDKTRTMLDTTPGLLNATWDWGGGDFETALGGASHMGRADIATFLLERGARIDLFCAAMLGHLEIVRAAIEARPSSASALGPHGITLIAHARKGGEPAARVVSFLESR